MKKEDLETIFAGVAFFGLIKSLGDNTVGKTSLSLDNLEKSLSMISELSWAAGKLMTERAPKSLFDKD